MESAVKKEGVKIIPLSVDVNEEKAASDAIEKCVKELGGLQILINAGIAQSRFFLTVQSWNWWEIERFFGSLGKSYRNKP